MGTRRIDTTAEHKIDFALESEPHCGSWSLHSVSVATEFLHQDVEWRESVQFISSHRSGPCGIQCEAGQGCASYDAFSF